MIPYEVFYGKQPPSITSYLLGTSNVQAVDTLLQTCEQTLVALKENLSMAQNHMKQIFDQHCFEQSFEVGDQVFLHVQPYKHTSPKAQGHQKLVPKFYGPYSVLQHIGQVVYKISLPTSFKIHRVFYVSSLKKFTGPNCRVQSTLLELDEEGSIWLQPKETLQTRE